MGNVHKAACKSEWKQNIKWDAILPLEVDRQPCPPNHGIGMYHIEGKKRYHRVRLIDGFFGLPNQKYRSFLSYSKSSSRSYHIIEK